MADISKIKLPSGNTYDIVDKKSGYKVVSINRKVDSGVNIADITIGDTTTQLYAPQGGGAGTITKVKTTAGAHTAIDVSSGAVNFNVPTKTSHLTNDSGFVTTDEKVKYTPVQGTDTNSYGLLYAQNNGSAEQTTSVYTGRVRFTPSAGQITIYKGDGSRSGRLSYKQLALTHDVHSYTGTLKVGTLTSGRSYDLPDASGTIALTSDIPDISGKVDKTCTYTNASGYSGVQTIYNDTYEDSGYTYDRINLENVGQYVDNNVTHDIVNSVTIDHSGVGIGASDGAGSYYANSWVVVEPDDVGLGIIGSNYASMSIGLAYSNGTPYAYINANTLELGRNTYRYTVDCSSPTANRTLTFPDKTGTIALTSDIPTVPTSAGSATTGVTIADHSSTTIYGVQSSTTSVTGVQSSTTTASKVTLGTAISVPNITAAGSGSFTQGSFSGGSLTMSINATDSSRLDIVFTPATHGADSHTHTPPTLGTAKSIPNVTGVSDVTVPIKNTSATTVPIKNSSTTTVITSKTHTVTDNGHTHSLS